MQIYIISAVTQNILIYFKVFRRAGRHASHGGKGMGKEQKWHLCTHTTLINVKNYHVPPNFAANILQHFSNKAIPLHPETNIRITNKSN